MIEADLWDKELFGETYAVSYAKAALWERFYGTEEPLRLVQANGEVSDNIRVGDLKEGDLFKPVSDDVPHLNVADGDDLKVVIRFVDKPQSEWDTEFRHESARRLEQCLDRGVRLIFVKVAGPEGREDDVRPRPRDVRVGVGPPVHLQCPSDHAQIQERLYAVRQKRHTSRQEPTAQGSDFGEPEICRQAATRPDARPRDLAEKCPCQGLYLALTEIAEIADAGKAIRSEGTVGS